MALVHVSFASHVDVSFVGASNVFPSALAVADVDNDGDNEIVIGTLDGYLSVIKGTRLWRSCDKLGTITCVACGPIRNNGENSLVVVVAEGTCYLFDFHEEDDIDQDDDVMAPAGAGSSAAAPVSEALSDDWTDSSILSSSSSWSSSSESDEGHDMMLANDLQNSRQRDHAESVDDDQGAPTPVNAHSNGSTLKRRNRALRGRVGRGTLDEYSIWFHDALREEKRERRRRRAERKQRAFAAAAAASASVVSQRNQHQQQQQQPPQQEKQQPQHPQQQQPHQQTPPPPPPHSHRKDRDRQQAADTDVDAMSMDEARRARSLRRRYRCRSIQPSLSTSVPVNCSVVAVVDTGGEGHFDLVLGTRNRNVHILTLHGRGVALRRLQEQHDAKHIAHASNNTARTQADSTKSTSSSSTTTTSTSPSTAARDTASTAASPASSVASSPAASPSKSPSRAEQDSSEHGENRGHDAEDRKHNDVDDVDARQLMFVPKCGRLPVPSQIVSFSTTVSATGQHYLLVGMEEGAVRIDQNHNVQPLLTLESQEDEDEGLADLRVQVLGDVRIPRSPKARLLPSSTPRQPHECYDGAVVMASALGDLCVLDADSNTAYYSTHLLGRPLALSCLDLTGDGYDEVVTCTWDGSTYIVPVYPAQLNEDNAADLDHGSAFAETWLLPQRVADDRGRRPDHPSYDPSTLLVPEEALAKMAPAQLEYWNLKRAHFDEVLVFRVGHYYEMFGVDADIGHRELGLTYLKGVLRHTRFPNTLYSAHAETLTRRGFRILCLDVDEGGALASVSQGDYSHSNPARRDRDASHSSRTAGDAAGDGGDGEDDDDDDDDDDEDDDDVGRRGDHDEDDDDDDDGVGGDDDDDDDNDQADVDDDESDDFDNSTHDDMDGVDNSGHAFYSGARSSTLSSAAASSGASAAASSGASVVGDLKPYLESPIRFDVSQRVCAFAAASYSLVPGYPTACFVYVTFDHQVLIYYDIFVNTNPRYHDFLSYLDMGRLVSKRAFVLPQESAHDPPSITSSKQARTKLLELVGKFGLQYSAFNRASVVALVRTLRTADHAALCEYRDRLLRSVSSDDRERLMATLSFGPETLSSPARVRSQSTPNTARLDSQWEPVQRRHHRASSSVNQLVSSLIEQEGVDRADVESSRTASSEQPSSSLSSSGLSSLLGDAAVSNTAAAPSNTTGSSGIAASTAPTSLNLEDHTGRFLHSVETIFQHGEALNVFTEVVQRCQPDALRGIVFWKAVDNYLRAADDSAPRNMFEIAYELVGMFLAPRAAKTVRVAPRTRLKLLRLVASQKRLWDARAGRTVPSASASARASSRRRKAALHTLTESDRVAIHRMKQLLRRAQREVLLALDPECMTQFLQTDAFKRIAAQDESLSALRLGRGIRLWKRLKRVLAVSGADPGNFVGAKQ